MAILWYNNSVESSKAGALFKSAVGLLIYNRAIVGKAPSIIGNLPPLDSTPTAKGSDCGGCFAMAMTVEEKRKKKTEWMRRYRREHPEKCAETQRRYHAKHPGLAAERSRKFRETHPETPEQRRARLDYTREYQLAHPDERVRISRKSHLKLTFGISLEEYQSIYDAQQGVCAICGQMPDDGQSLAVDHEHVTGEIRGLLCKKCNTALGSFQDSIDILLSAIEYIQKHSQPEFFRVGDIYSG